MCIDIVDCGSYLFTLHPCLCQTACFSLLCCAGYNPYEDYNDNENYQEDQ